MERSATGREDAAPRDGEVCPSCKAMHDDRSFLDVLSDFEDAAMQWALAELDSDEGREASVAVELLREDLRTMYDRAASVDAPTFNDGPDGNDGGCGEVLARGYECTRHAKHDGPHQAWGTMRLCAQWPNDGEPRG